MRIWVQGFDRRTVPPEVTEGGAETYDELSVDSFRQPPGLYIYVLYVYPYPTHVPLDIRDAKSRLAVRFCDSQDSPKAVLRSRTRPRRSICTVKKRTISHISFNKLELFPSRPALFFEADLEPGGRKRERKNIHR